MATPPLGLRRRAGAFDDPHFFEQSGRDLARNFVELCQVESDAHVLDLGCGAGRVAVHLTGHLARGRYVGIDVDPDAIRWCKQSIGEDNANFSFEHLDAKSMVYYPEGTADSASISLPFTNDSFDAICAASVFTHLRAAALENYMAECARVLRPGGRMLASFFLLDEKALTAIDAGHTALAFAEKDGPGKTLNSERPEQGMAYPPSYVLTLCEAMGFIQAQSMLTGSWRRERDEQVTQDIMVVKLK